MGIGGKNNERYLIYVQNRKALVDYATPIVGSRAEAEDIVQDAYLRFVPEERDIRESHKGYLFTIVRNLSLSRRSKRKRAEAIASDDIPWWALPMSVNTPENDLLFCERVKWISQAVEALPDKSRMVLEMYRFQGLTLREISEKLNISNSTAHRLLLGAMRDIREKMDDDA